MGIHSKWIQLGDTNLYLKPLQRQRSATELEGTWHASRTHVAVLALHLRNTSTPPREYRQDDCASKTAKNCGDDCPECPIEIRERTVYPKCEAMVPGYGGHVPGITTCKFGKTFGRETREALQKVYSTPRLKPHPKKC